MPTKTILITQPTHPILRRLAMRFLRKPELRVACFDRDSLLQEITFNHGELQFSIYEPAPVDSIWHAGTAAHSLEESQAAMHQVLSFAQQHQAAIHYVTASYGAKEE